MLSDVLESARNVRAMADRVECPTVEAFKTNSPFGSGISMGRLCQIWTDSLDWSRQVPEDVGLDSLQPPSPLLLVTNTSSRFETFWPDEFLN